MYTITCQFNLVKTLCIAVTSKLQNIIEASSIRDQTRCLPYDVHNMNVGLNELNIILP